MDKASDAPRPVSVHSTPTRVLAGVVLAICAALAINLVMAGTPTSIWHFLPWLLFVAWGIFVLLWRPRLLVRTDGLTVNNLLRDHEIPFSELTALRVVQSVSFDTTAGRISSWGAPGTGKLGPRRGSTGPAGLPTLPHTQTVIQNAWDVWERKQSRGMHDAGTSSQPRPDSQPGQGGKVTSRWNLPVVVVGFIFLALGVISTLT